MKFGDISICRIPFTSGELSKPRPALVLFDADLDVVICRITVGMHSGATDVPLGDWARWVGQEFECSSEPLGNCGEVAPANLLG